MVKNQLIYFCQMKNKAISENMAYQVARGEGEKQYRVPKLVNNLGKQLAVCR